MKISSSKIFNALFFGFALILSALLFTHTRTARSKISNLADVKAVPRQNFPESAKVVRGVAPFIVRDTENDSPGTNFVTRIVTFTADIAGTPAPALQWQINRGGGYENISGATNSIYRIANAQVTDDGFYSLLATNSAGWVRTTSQRLIVSEGED